MFSRWPIQTKLLTGLFLLVVCMILLAVSGFIGVIAYRDLARTINVRAAELPLAAELTQRITDLRDALSRVRGARKMSHSPFDQPMVDSPLLYGGVDIALFRVDEALTKYRNQLDANLLTDEFIGDNRQELETVAKIEASLERVHEINEDANWVVDDVAVVEERLDNELNQMTELAKTLPTFLQARMQTLVDNVRSGYHTLIFLMTVSCLVALGMFVALAAFYYKLVYRPLNELILDSRKIAGGDFDHRIRTKSEDEMAELAHAMNDMTQRFQEIRDELDSQVKIRTKQVIRNEQLASVGFLAAGVAHEINNPLASVAWSAEAMESRLAELFHEEIDAETERDEERDEDIKVFKTYLKRIQDEAFRCKGITERLLDYSRMSDVEKDEVDLAEIVEGVIEMVKHLGNYREKNIVFDRNTTVKVSVNPQEIKQVVLNLITNSLDALDPGGEVQLSVKRINDSAVLMVQDNGCGMSEETMQHLFEPFFTRRRDGSGTGLGLSITYRIISDHGGDIEPYSDGPGTGSRFKVTLPLVGHGKSSHGKEERNQAA